VRIRAGGARQLASLPRLEVWIEEMSGSDWSRPIDYERAVVVDAERKENEQDHSSE
jgi:hypothetical protein